jgi:hypothetical protein
VVSDGALGAAEFATIYSINANLSIIRWSDMPAKQYPASAAEFRCQFPCRRRFCARNSAAGRFGEAARKALLSHDYSAMER